jgi:hypothetical protein
MEEWLLMQGFYHGLTQKAREHLDATAGGSFLSLTVGKAKTIIEKISENQGWSKTTLNTIIKVKKQLKK